MVVVATNVAETSITLPNVRYVVVFRARTNGLQCKGLNELWLFPQEPPPSSSFAVPLLQTALHLHDAS